LRPPRGPLDDRRFPPKFSLLKSTMAGDTN